MTPGRIGPIPYRLLLAGGWIDQPFVNEHDPSPPGSMVVVSLEPDRLYMERAGMATSSRKVAARLWPTGLPEDVPREELVRLLYEEENRGRAEPSGSQDMIGLIHPGISRLDYDHAHDGGVFPAHVESCVDAEIAAWLTRVIHVLPVAPRPDGYDTLGDRRVSPEWVRRLGRSGADCFDAILAGDVRALGDTVNECMRCWEAMLPRSFVHPVLTADWPGLLDRYQAKYEGAMASASGGGYLYVITEREVPGTFHPSIRLS